MHKISLNAYFKKLDLAYDNKNGKQLSDFLSYQDNHILNSNLQIEHPEGDVEKYFEPPLDELVAAHLRGCWALSNEDFLETYKCQCLVVQAFTKILQTQKEENWSLLALFSLSLHLRLLAYKADEQVVKSNPSKKGECLEKAAEVLMGCFRICASDNRAQPEDSKKWGMLNLVNQLFKIYFKINKLHLCKPLIRAVDSLPFKEKFSISQLVTYRYYVGKKAMFESDFKSADDFLSFAFQHCHKDAKKNKRLILIYLLPVKMLLGYMPNINVLTKYSLMEFAEVAKAVRLGDLKLFKDAIADNEAFFIKCGVYLILEKLKIIAYRNLIKKVSLIMKTHQMSMAAFTDAFNWIGEDVDEDEMQCILANLIYEDKIKGYLSYQHKKLVVSKQNAFPTLPIKLKA